MSGQDRGNDQTLNFYGDQTVFEYRRIIDMAQKRVTVDSKFTGQAEFSIDDHSALRFTGSFSSKNKMSVGYIYPRLRY